MNSQTENQENKDDRPLKCSHMSASVVQHGGRSHTDSCPELSSVFVAAEQHALICEDKQPLSSWSSTGVLCDPSSPEDKHPPHPCRLTVVL